MSQSTYQTAGALEFNKALCYVDIAFVILTDLAISANATEKYPDHSITTIKLQRNFSHRVVQEAEAMNDIMERCV